MAQDVQDGVMDALWRVHPADPSRAARLGRAADVHPVMAQLLLNRGVSNPAEATRFLRPGLRSLEDPARVPGMTRGMDRIRRAIDEREPILIFSDSDVDGLTASAILYEVLRELGASVRVRHANRITSGYGVPMALIRQLARSATRLVILVDCGTNQAEEVAALAAHGIETIVVDHHVVGARPAIPYALINPHAGDGDAGRELCSAGLAFKVAQAFFGQEIERLAAYLDLAALGTLADCSPLRGDSRAIVSDGLARIVESQRPGLRELCEATKTRQPDPEQILKRLVPRLNASGRLGDASMAWRLLLADGAGEWEDWMAAVDAAHATTKQLRRRIIGEAQEQVNRLHFRDAYVMVVSRRGWHQGLMGALASQLAERYHRPAIAIALHDRRGVGSGRSIPMFNLLGALEECRELLVQFGGHAQACGLTVDVDHLERFHALVNQQAQRALGRDGLVPSVTMDLELPLDAVQPSWVEPLCALAPHGRGNPPVTVIVRDVSIEVTSPRIGWVSDGRTRVAARGSLTGLVDKGRYDVAVSPAMDEGTLTLTLRGVRDAGALGGPGRISSTSCTPGSA